MMIFNITEERQLLQCMPYVNNPSSDAPKSYYDIEVENSTGAELLKDLEDIMNGKYKKDKYGNEIQLSSHEEKYLFAKDILQHAFAYDMIVSKLTPMEKKKLDNLLKV